MVYGLRPGFDFPEKGGLTHTLARQLSRSVGRSVVLIIKNVQAAVSKQKAPYRYHQTPAQYTL